MPRAFCWSMVYNHVVLLQIPQVTMLSSLLRAWGEQQIAEPWAFFQQHPALCTHQTPITLIRMFQAFADTHWHL